MATKILIRYIGGSSGRFLGLLIKSFTVPVKLINPYFAHRNSEIFRHSTMTKINDSDDLYKYSGYHLTKVSSEDAVKWWKENLKFDESSDIIVDDYMITRVCNFGDMQFPSFFEQYDPLDDFNIYVEIDDEEEYIEYNDQDDESEY